MKRTNLLALLGLLTFTPALQAVSIKTHFETMNSSDPNMQNLGNTYLNGIVETSMYMNAVLDQRNQPKLFCLPKKMALNHNHLKNIIKDTYEISIPDSKKSPNLNTSMIAVIGLIETYPCHTEAE